jgi:N-methylhydantoinase A
VGPQSAGSSPGPACYGWGGTSPTVSDANLILGRLNPDYFLGGKLTLYLDRAKEAVKRDVADKMGVSLEEAAAGIIRIVNANMAKGISGNSVERGYDLREFALITMGGAAALHASDIAGELNMDKVIVPPMSGNFSAVGLVVADIQHDYVRTIAKKDYQIDPAELLGAFKEIEEDGIRQLAEEKVSEESIEITWSADLRYEGQSWELNAPVEPVSEMNRANIKKIINDFNDLHKQIYSYSEPKEVVEFVNLRVRVKGKHPALSLPTEKKTVLLIEDDWKDMRDVYFENLGWQKIPVYEREHLNAGSKIIGPSLIEETISTTLIAPEVYGFVDEYRNIIIGRQDDV